MLIFFGAVRVQGLGLGGGDLGLWASGVWSLGFEERLELQRLRV